MGKNSDILLSIIVPVYNVEQFLVRCLSSILGQTYCNFELILIDDGSTDTSGVVCDQVAERDKRVRVIHKSNEGLVPARKCGLTQARGRLVSFIDSDDWIEANMYEKLIEIYIQEGYPDIVSSGIIFEYPKADMQETVSDGMEDGKYDRGRIEQEIVPALIYDPVKTKAAILTSVCTKLISREIAVRAMEYMDPLLSIGEDGAYSYLLILCCSSLAVTHRAYYHYEQHENSMNSYFGVEVFQKLIRLKTAMTGGISRLGEENNRQIQEQINYYVWGYLYQLIEEQFHLGIGHFMYLFPFARCPQNCTVLLYGAGAVGKSYMKCLKQSLFAERIIWADKNYEQLQAAGWNVVSADEALQEAYDYIVIAIEDGEQAEEIRESFVNRGIEKEKIIWEKPVRITPFN